PAQPNAGPWQQDRRRRSFPGCNRLAAAAHTGRRANRWPAVSTRCLAYPNTTSPARVGARHGRPALEIRVKGKFIEWSGNCEGWRAVSRRCLLFRARELLRERETASGLLLRESLQHRQADLLTLLRMKLSREQVFMPNC